jgi:amino acid adenylation domain-containing protein
LGEVFSQAPLLATSQAKRQQLLVEWNNTEKPYRRDACFHDLFQEQSARSPDSIAAVYHSQSLTYRELNERADRWASALQGMGVGPEVLVGVSLEPSLELLVALLSILKAGGAYVPLDPVYPPKRLAFMIEDADLGIIVTSEAVGSTLPQNSARLVQVGTLDASTTSALQPDRKAFAENLAYVIFTSGSTGRPKGAMITHRGLANYLTWAVEAYQVDHGTGAPVYSSVSFDLTITALFTPLLTGGRVTLLSSKEAVDGLSALLKSRQNFSLVKITPAHLDLLRTRLVAADLIGSTRTFVIGGEAITSENLRFWQEQAPGITLVNEYGPTETVVGCCVYFAPSLPGGPRCVPIGRPIANTQLYVLDSKLEPVPIGEPGELYVGGDGVGRGYLNRPELTAERFIRNPFAQDVPNSSPTLYRTGDLARYRPDGNLEFLGRIDHQVKVNGYRIETGEIESLLATHPQVLGAAVTAKGDKKADRYLIAYLAVEDEEDPSDSQLRTFLNQHIPEYMVPARFVRLRQLPLTTNGKVDREALPEPDALPIPAVTAPPYRDTVACLIALWQKLLERKQIQLDDNFFELGGNSLLAVRLVLEINQIFKKELRSLALYENPTVRQLAALVERGSSAAKDDGIMTVFPGDGGRPVFVLNLSSEIFSLVPKLRERPESFQASHVHWQTEQLEASSRMELSHLPSLPQIAAPHTRRILQSGHAQSCVLAGFSYGGPLAFEVAHQLNEAGVSVAAVILLDADLKIPTFQRLKQRARRGLTKVARRSHWAVHMVLDRFRAPRLSQSPQNVEQPKAATDNWENPLILDEADQVVQWELVQQIWVHALRRYRPRRLQSRGILIRAEKTWYSAAQNYDGCLGWKGLFSQGLAIVQVPGDHMTMWRPPHSEQLAQALIQTLESLGSFRTPE